MEDFSLLHCVKKYTESKEDTQPRSFASAKKTRRGKECAALGCSNTFYNSEGTATGILFSRFPPLPSEINHCCTRTLIIRHNNKVGFYISRSTVLFHHHFMGTDIKKSSLSWKLLPVFVLSQNLTDKTFTPKKERKGEGGLVG